MDKLIHGPSVLLKNQNNSPESGDAPDSGGKDFHNLETSNLLEDFKVFALRPRKFFEFFANKHRIGRVTWAKVILVFLGISALQSMIVFSQNSGVSWSSEFTNFDPKTQAQISHFLEALSAISSQLFVALGSFFLLFFWSVWSLLAVLFLKLLVRNSQTISWAGVFCVFVTSSWTNILILVPYLGQLAAAIMSFVYIGIGISQISRSSFTRSMMAAYVIPTIAVTALSVLAAFMIAFMISGLFT